MFDAYAQSLFDALPNLDGLDGAEARRMLTRAYLSIVQLRMGSDLNGADSTGVVNYLRRLADAMESYAVFETEAPRNARTAAAFIAAESLALAAEYFARIQEAEIHRVRLRRSDLYTRVESSLLYLLGEFDACAAGVVREIPSGNPEGNIDERAAEWCMDVVRSFCQLSLGPLPHPPEIPEGPRFLNARELEGNTIARLYLALGNIFVAFMRRLAGGEEESLEAILAQLDRLISALSVRPHNKSACAMGVGLGDDFARVHHLAVIARSLFESLDGRSLQTLPSPPGIDPVKYRAYLSERATGGERQAGGRPVLWPSALEYVKACVQGQTPHAVVSMPTGSGKSFLAEIAISQCLGLGWCLYLVPTNALAEQVRGDLKVGLRALETQIMAFIGDQEYSSLATEAVPEIGNNAVAVMTPEKCALALRLHPEAFANCRVIVFDECHLIGETGSGRGITAELVLTQLMIQCPQARLLLMSAIVQNPEELAAWIEEAMGSRTGCLRVAWRPTRTLRGGLAVDNRGGVAQAAYDVADTALRLLPENRKNVPFEAPFCLTCGLQGAWQSTDEPDYAVVRLPAFAHLAANRKKVGGQWLHKVEPKSWVNGSASRVAQLLATRGIQTLVFTPASKHYPFCVADGLQLSPEILGTLSPLPVIVGPCEVLAQYEFDTTSEVFALLHRGISVHTALMLETEKIASEHSFRGHSTRVMIATGTLAQGLNLPAMAVVIAGTRIGDPRGEDFAVVERRKLSQLLNAAGRAGRAGFANQGLVIAVPDSEYFIAEHRDSMYLRNELRYLQTNDDAVEVASGLDRFLDELAAATLTTDSASGAELQAIAVLSGGDPQQPAASDVLAKSFAMFRRRRRGSPDVSAAGAVHLTSLRDHFVANNGAPQWLPLAAQRAGLDFLTTLRLWQAWTRVYPALPQESLAWSVWDWTIALLRVTAHVPPAILMRRMSTDTLKRGNERLATLILTEPETYLETDPNWTVPPPWIEGWTRIEALLRPWMEGTSIAEIASTLTGRPLAGLSTARTTGSHPIPKALALVNELWSELAIIAGGVVAIIEFLVDDLNRQLPAHESIRLPLSMECLPMCIKYGFLSPQSLAWFRFGLRLRRPAHLLAQGFPPPTDLDDEQLRDWVRGTRRDWLAGRTAPPEQLAALFGEVFAAANEFIVGGR